MRAELISPDVARRYDATVWYWDSLFYRSAYGPAYRRLFEGLANEGWLGDAGSRLRVLDCGIGTGLLTAGLLQAVGRRLDVSGVDVSPKMLAKARQRLLKLGVTPRLEVGDARSLGFRDGEMDLVISALMLEHLPDPLEAVREMTRVARPGAAIVLVMTRQHAPDALFRLVFRYRPFRAAEVNRWMTQAGITRLTYRRMAGVARPFICAFIGRKREQ